MQHQLRTKLVFDDDDDDVCNDSLLEILQRIFGCPSRNHDGRETLGEDCRVSTDSEDFHCGDHQVQFFLQVTRYHSPIAPPEGKLWIAIDGWRDELERCYRQDLEKLFGASLQCNNVKWPYHMLIRLPAAMKQFSRPIDCFRQIASLRSLVLGAPLRRVLLGSPEQGVPQTSTHRLFQHSRRGSCHAVVGCNSYV